MKTSLCIALACVVASLACGGDSSSGQGDNNGDTGSGVPIRNGARIGWDQPVDAPATARGYTYKVYVDGAAMALSEVTCGDVRTAGGVACSGRLPNMSAGRHTLELTAFINGFESTRSQPLVVSITGLTAPEDTSSSSLPLAAPGGQVVGCLAQDNCDQQTTIATGKGAVSFPTSAGTELFFVEDAARVRVLVGGTLQEAPALQAGPRARITGLAIPPDYERSRAVFVAWSESSPDGSETLNVTRYRELLGSLGEGATIVTGLPVPPRGPAPIAIDDRGRLYVALSNDGRRTSAPSDLVGYILRFEADGTVAQSNPTSSPVIAQGYSRPVSLVWDAVARQLWLSGTDSSQTAHVSLLPVDPQGRSEWPWALTDAAIRPGDGSDVPPVLAVTADAAQTQSLWTITDAGAERMVIADSSRPSLEPVAVARVAAVTDGPGDSVFVFTQWSDGTRYEVRQLLPAPASR